MRKKSDEKEVLEGISAKTDAKNIIKKEHEQKGCEKGKGIQ
jgi:hypothetical protein